MTSCFYGFAPPVGVGAACASTMDPACGARRVRRKKLLPMAESYQCAADKVVCRCVGQVPQTSWWTLFRLKST